MCKKIRALILLTIFFFLWAPFLFPALASPDAEYDYVDNNNSNMDLFPDKGTHSNFTAQQYIPDSIYDILTEESTAGFSLEDFVDNDASNVDDSADVGTLSNFDNMKTKDGLATLTEELSTVWINNTQPANLILETDPDISSLAITYETYGLANLASNDGTYGGGDIQDNGATNNPQEVSLIMEFDYSDKGISGNDISYLRFEAEVYFIGGTSRAPLTDPWEMETTFYNGSVDVYNWYTDSWEIMGTAFIDNSADLSIWDNIGDINPERPLIRYKDSGFSDNHVSPTGVIRIRIQMTGVFQGTAYDGCSVIDYVDVDLQYGGGDCLLDQEVQWTDVPYFLPNENISIYCGTMGTEDLKVDVWNGTGWETVFTDLSSGWNNASVTDWLTTSTFTIRFKDGDEAEDITQDTWQIDSCLLKVEGSGSKEDVVDNNISDVDSSPDVGSHSNFENQKARDSSYDTLTEQNTAAGEITKVGTDTSGSGNSLTLSFSHILVSGTARIVIVSIGIENGDTIDVSTVTYGGVTMTFAVEGITGTSGFRFLAEIWYILENDLPSDGSQTVEITCSGTPSSLEVNGFCSEYTGVTQGAPEATAEHHQTTGTTITNDISPSDNAWIISVVGCGNVGSFTHGQGQIEVSDFQDASSTFAVAELREASGESSLDSTYSGTVNRLERVAASWSRAIEGINHVLDLEIQWTNLPYQVSNEELCIYGGTIGSEDIRVEAWHGTGWETIFTDLSSGWNNASVTDWLTTSTFTIRFKDGDEAEDITQDQWQIDIALIHVWSEVNYELDLEVQWTNATFTLPFEELCIFGGTMGSEDIRVDVWNGSAWNNLLTDLSSGWNNVSVTDYLISSIFTIRFKGGTETGDAYQDSWEIDSVLLHTWGIAPIANFSFTPEYPYTGEIVAFNASASYDPDGVIVSFFWDFGDGANGTGETINHAYADNGIHTVTLTVTDNHGVSDTTFADIDVLNRAPTASFTESAETVLTSETIYFNASASYDPDGAIVSYFWDFGDGTNATGMIVDHAYAENGIHTVTFTIIDDDGATDTATATKTVSNRHPVATFTESTSTVDTGEIIYFDASGSYDSDGSIVIYFWDFGDGSNATGIFVNHSYIDDGIYTVLLTITDDDATTDSNSATKTVLNRLPVAVFTESAETVYTGEVVYFSASDSYDPDGSVIIYFWDFGDGTNATGVTAQHSYADNGNLTVTLTVTDNDGVTDITTATKTLLNQPPVAIFTESTETAYAGETITFDASGSYDSDGSIVIYFWDFGDGSNATGIIVEHAYSTNETYIVTLIVTDDDSTLDSTSSTKTILGNEPPVALFTESSETVFTGETIYINASASYDPDGTVINYFWNFGDGANATGVAVDHTYIDDGVYVLTLTVTDDRDATSTTSATKTVLNRPPTALFTESAETVNTGEIINFNATNSYDPDGTITSCFWDFGDDTNETSVIVAHSYADNGTYIVTLTVTDDDGATASTTATKNVLNRIPVAVFTESAETVYTGETIIFNASTSYDVDGYIISYFWDFGDGTNTTGMIISYAYVDKGTYNVILTVTDDDGATHTSSSTKTILNNPPVSSFIESAETVYTSEIITFNASGSYDSDGSIVSYFWDFGDGFNATGAVVNHAYFGDGIYTVTLTVTDNDGATASANAAKTVLNQFPVALFTESAEMVLTDEAITFNASDSFDPDGSIVSYVWDFGDGTNATGVIVAHSYVDDGIYTVTLIVTDNDGASASTSSTKTVLNRSPTAFFSESGETVNTGEIITFNASGSYDSDGSIASYFWDFGDGKNATGVAVGYSYIDNGIYAVTLTITDDDGATDTTTSIKTVLNRPPTAIFTESAETAYTGEVITFNASDSYDSDGTIESYFWDFGDGTNATGIVAQHGYFDDGNYTVTLIATDNDGSTSSTSATKTVLNRAPVAVFTESAETAYTGEAITFNASSSFDPDGSIVSYVWDFGDGTNATGVIVTHTYTDNGTPTVTLMVTDDEGAINSTTATKTILNRLPVASFTESAETVITGIIITFDASGSYDSDGSIISYFWDFGDGTNSTGITIGHAYGNDGNYTVTLKATDDDGAIATATAAKTVLNRSPIAVFTTSATTVLTGQIVYFDASGSYDSDGTIVSFFWGFGDGTNATGMGIEHAYADDGIYVVALTVTDDDGAVGGATATIQVLNRAPVVVFTESTATVYTGEVITFNASDSYDSDGTIESYFWDFGDGTNATSMIVTHAYAVDGIYTVTLAVTDDDGATSNTTSTKAVLNKQPVADFTESANTMLIGEIIYFNASASYDPDGTIVSYSWDFGDGTNATGTTSEHAYLSSGVYTVTLSVTDDDGATGTTTAIKTAEVTPPVAAFTESTETVFTGEIIYFNASASYDPDGTVVSYFWNFGDGSNATGIMVEHAYADDGNYTVILTVTDDDGATNSASATKNILNGPPVASFTESVETVYTDEMVTFNATASYDPDGSIVSYFWDFGDGTNFTGVIVTHSYNDNETYTVALIVTDDDGTTSTTASVKTVLNSLPVAIFTESAETLFTEDTVTFNASDSYDSDGTIVSYFWDFGDGSNATGITVEHTFAGDGNYTVSLTVTDDDGATDTTIATKTVLNRPPVAVFTESAESVLIGEVVYFNASASYDPDGIIISYFWDFGDGANTTGVTAEHTYTMEGTYTVTIIITDNDGATASTTATKIVGNNPPVAIFTESAETVYTSEIITFNASGSFDSDGSIVIFFWTFGDGANATGAVVDHSYVDDGNYMVFLTVTDDDGSTESASATKTVLNRLPVVTFTESAESVLSGEVIYFNASGSYDPDGSIVSYFWDFGDGTNATGITVEHAFTMEGTYTVTLIVTDDDGATTSSTVTKFVGNSPPLAIFTESAQTVYTGVVVSFDASDSYDPDGVIVSYFWNFGDGTNTTGISVGHAYSDNGTYTVALTIIDDDGAATAVTSIKTILNRFPVASFTESATTVFTGANIHFDASESYDSDGLIASYFWDFGDGTNTTGVIVDHTYNNDGSHVVSLTVTDDDGSSSTATATKTILNKTPVALFTESAVTVFTSETITFNATDSYDPDGIIISYFWDFGDGTNATGVVANHTYVDHDIYTVTLTVTDDEGGSSSSSAAKNVLNRPPIAMFTESAETVDVDEIVYFNASASYDLDGTIVSYSWDFGDGTNAIGVTVEHTYVVKGVYTVTLTVTDDDGATIAISATKLVAGEPPVALFTESAVTVFTSETITFNATDSYDPDGIIISYFWDFGDGTNATGVVVGHIYEAIGNYTVTLTVTDEDGVTSNVSSTKMVLNSPPVASYTESTTLALTDEVIYFDASASYDPESVIISYEWNFGDGVNATGIFTQHTYADNGVYRVTLTVTDDDGSTASTSSTKMILNRSPIASFTESAETAYTGETISFNASSSYDPDGYITYSWDFGDGSTATADVVNHVYADDGIYIVTLTVTDDDDATKSASATKTILNRSPMASFTESMETAYTGETISFSAGGSYDLDGTIISYSWDFGDGNSATGVSVGHAYADNGAYTVTLTVTDNDAAAGTAFSIKTALNRAPVASFTESEQTVYTGELITFSSYGSYDLDGTISTYFWDFGDGSYGTGTLVGHIYAHSGTYTVTLRITDNDGATDSAASTKTILNRPPIAMFTESAETEYVNGTITFNASESYDIDGSIVSYFWDFGDGSNTTDVVASHAYSTDGTFTVTLTVTDNDGETDSMNSIKTVLVNQLPVALFIESAETVYTGQMITFNASSSYDPNGFIASYTWDFGDASNTMGTVAEHSYVDYGVYEVTLTVTDNNGGSSSISATKTVLNRAPIASFNYTPISPVAGETVTFNASASYDPDGYTVIYFWNLGDGENATGVIVTHSYADNGTYTITLTIEDNEGLIDTGSKILNIGVSRHDVTVISVHPSSTEIYLGQAMNISVTVRNEGETSETFNVTIYQTDSEGWQLEMENERLAWFSAGEDLGNMLLSTFITVPTTNPVLTFDTIYDFELLSDFGFVQISTDGGVTWASLENIYTTYDYNPGVHSDIIANLPGLTGTSDGWPRWVTMTFNLTDYAGETARLGFRYMTDEMTLGKGWYIDNVIVGDIGIPNEVFEPYNSNAVVIQTKTLASLAPGNQTTITFTWNTTGLSLGYYLIGAVADIVPGETSKADNTLFDSWVSLIISGDINGDGKVDVLDLILVANKIGWTGPPGSISEDVNRDGAVNVLDLILVANLLGEVNP